MNLRFRHTGAQVWVASLALFAACLAPAHASEQEQLAIKAPAYRGQQPVTPMPDGNILAEAEEFRVKAGGELNWRPRNWGENYYAATFANTFLSRKAFLQAPPQAKAAEASIEVDVAQAGKYAVLARYEAAYRFETQFKLRVEQNGKVLLDRLYGARNNLKVWAFRGDGGLKTEVAWYWGAVENVVWEGHDVAVDLQPGRANITLVADFQPEPAANRNVDCILLTRDIDDVNKRIANEAYLALDGLLTQGGDVWVRLQNRGKVETKLVVSPGREHSPYWIHMRRWAPLTITAMPNAASEWVEVGSLLDTLNDGQWGMAAGLIGKLPPAENSAGGANASLAEEFLNYRVEVGVRDAKGKIEQVAQFDSKKENLRLAYDGNTRYSRRVRAADQVLYDLVAYLKKNPVPGSAPKRTIIYGYTFDPLPDNNAYEEARKNFISSVGLTTSEGSTDIAASGPPIGYIDVRGMTLKDLEARLARYRDDGLAARIRCVSLGDEIGLDTPPADAHEAFRAWAKERGLKPAQVDPAAGEDWAKVMIPVIPPAPADRAVWIKANPASFYYSSLFAQAYGVRVLKTRTDLIRQYLPNADTGANFSPHAGAPYVGDANKYITLFRREGMTMPWGEDYIWQIPVGSQQMNFLQVDMFRAGLRYAPPQRAIQMYVMPHWPGNTLDGWRRQFYGVLGSGARIINLFEFRPVQAAYTENHVSLPEMFREVRKGLFELTSFEDIVQDGHVRWGDVALWYSQAGDIWGNYRHPLGAAKRSLYVAIRHQQVALDIVDEEDALKGTLKSYRALYLTDANVSQAASKAIAAWVEEGGRLFATAGAGMFDEYNAPNATLRQLLGVEQTSLEDSGLVIQFEKQDLPFAEPVAQVTWKTTDGERKMKAYGTISKVSILENKEGKLTSGTQVRGTFGDGGAAITTKTTGKGSATYCAFLPSLTYFKRALPLRPVDRGSTDEAMAHLIPINFDQAADILIGSVVADLPRVVTCSEKLVQASVIDGPKGVVVALVNWSGGPVKALKVTLTGKFPEKATLAGGGKISRDAAGEKTVLTFDLDVADAIVLR